MGQILNMHDKSKGVGARDNETALFWARLRPLSHSVFLCLCLSLSVFLCLSVSVTGSLSLSLSLSLFVSVPLSLSLAGSL